MTTKRIFALLIISALLSWSKPCIQMYPLPCKEAAYFDIYPSLNRLNSVWLIQLSDAFISSGPSMFGSSGG